jgi:hypothetical protein
VVPIMRLWIGMSTIFLDLGSYYRDHRVGVVGVGVGVVVVGVGVGVGVGVVMTIGVALS